MGKNPGRRDDEEEDEGEEVGDAFDYLLTYSNGFQRRAYSHETFEQVMQRWKTELGARSPRVMRFPPDDKSEGLQLTRFLPRKVKIMPDGKPWLSSTGVPLNEDGEPVVDAKGDVIEEERYLPVVGARADLLIDIELVGGDLVEDDEDDDEGGEEGDEEPQDDPSGKAKAPPASGVSPKPLPAGFLSE